MSEELRKAFGMPKPDAKSDCSPGEKSKLNGDSKGSNGEEYHDEEDEDLQS